MFSTVNTAQPPQPRWYRVPWVWLVIAIPATSVLMGIVMISIAIKSYDGLVADDYYKRGLEINRQLERDQAATDYGLQADIRLNRSKNTLVVKLASASSYDPPSQLRVQFIHHTRAGFDREFSVVRDSDGAYRSPAPPLAPGAWTLRIAADDWRLQAISRLEEDVTLHLAPLVSH